MTAAKETHCEPRETENGDWVCQHGTAMDVHCCNCHSGFLFDSDSCRCTFDSDGEDGPSKADVQP